MFRIRTPLFEGESGAGTGAGGGGGGGTLLSPGAGAGAASAGAAAGASAATSQGGGGDEPPSFDFRSSLDDKGNFRQGWQDSLPDSMKEFSGVFGKYPNPVEALRALGHAQKTLGQRQQVKPPGADARPDEIAAWNKTLGVPDSPEGYGLKAPEKLPEGVKWDDAEAGKFAKLAHEIGLTPAQAAKLVEYDLGQKSTMHQTGTARLAEFVEGQRKALADEWGDKFQDNIGQALHAAQLLGLDPEDPEVGNNAKLIKALYQSSQLMSEDKLVGTERSGASMSNQQIADDILSNPNNPWHAAYHGQEGAARQKEAQQHRFGLLGYRM